MLRDTIPDALADALGLIIAEQRKQWAREVELMAAESRATIAELRADIAALTAKLAESASASIARVDTAIASIVNGKDTDPAETRAMVEEAVVQHLDRIALPAQVESAVADAVKALPPAKDGEDGKSVDLDEVERMIAKSVEALPIVETIAEHLDAALRQIPPAKDGKDIDPAAVEQMVEEKVAKAVAEIPQAKDGVTPDEQMLRSIIEPLVERAAGAAVAALPPPKDGADADMDVLKEHAAQVAAEAVAAIPRPADGKDVDMEVVRSTIVDAAKDIITSTFHQPADGKDADMEEVKAQVEDQVAKALDAWPKPKDGTSVTIEDITPVLTGMVDEMRKALPVPKDGVSLAGALLDREGNLVVTLSNGETRELGCVVGKDADMNALIEVAKAEIAKLPAPKDGVDGVGFDDMELSFDGEKTFVFTFTKGDIVKEARIKTALPVHRGFWEKEKTYEPGDVVSFQGNSYIARVETSAATGDLKAWGIMAKRGKHAELPAAKASGPAPRVTIA